MCRSYGASLVFFWFLLQRFRSYGASGRLHKRVFISYSRFVEREWLSIAKRWLPSFQPRFASRRLTVHRCPWWGATRVFNYSDDLQLDSESVSGIYSNVMKRDYSTSGYTGRILEARSHWMCYFKPIKQGVL